MSRLFEVELSYYKKPLTTVHIDGSNYFVVFDSERDIYELYHYLSGEANLIYESENYLKVLKGIESDKIIVCEDYIDDDVMFFYLLNSNEIEKIHKVDLAESETINRVVCIQNYLFYSLQDDETDLLNWVLLDLDEPDVAYDAKALKIFSSVFDPKLTIYGGDLYIIALEMYMMPQELKDNLCVGNEICEISNNRLVGIKLETLICEIKTEAIEYSWTILYRSQLNNYIVDFEVNGDVLCCVLTNGYKDEILSMSIEDKSSVRFRLQHERLSFVKSSNAIYIVCLKDGQVSKIYSHRGEDILTSGINEPIDNIVGFAKPEVVDFLNSDLLIMYEKDEEQVYIQVIDINRGECTIKLIGNRLFNYNDILYKC